MPSSCIKQIRSGSFLLCPYYHFNKRYNYSIKMYIISFIEVLRTCHILWPSIISSLAVNLWGVQVTFLPGVESLDEIAEVLLAGDHIALKDLVQGDALEAQANDLITHLQHSRKQTLSHTLVTNNELRGTKLQTLRFTFITRSSAEL